MADAEHQQLIGATWAFGVVLGLQIFCFFAYYLLGDPEQPRTSFIYSTVLPALGSAALVVPAHMTVSVKWIKGCESMIFISCTITEVFCFLLPVSRTVKLSLRWQLSDIIPIAGVLAYTFIFIPGLVCFIALDTKWLFIALIGPRAAFLILPLYGIHQYGYKLELVQLFLIGVLVCLASVGSFSGYMAGAMENHLLWQCAAGLLYIVRSLAVLSKTVPEFLRRAWGTRTHSISINGETVNRMAPNGTSIDKTSINGTSINGTSINGTSINGTSINGTSINGTSINGTSINGTSINKEDTEGRAITADSGSSEERQIEQDAYAVSFV